MSTEQTVLAAVTGWLRDLAAHRSQRVRAVPGGFVVRHDDFPGAHDHNKLVVSGPCDADALADAADDALADLGHRLIDVLDFDVAQQLTAGLVARGYTWSDDLLMLWTGSGAVRSPRVVELALSERATVATASWQAEQADQPADLRTQLGERAATIADLATFLAVRGGSGDVVARTDLFVWNGIGQVEEVMTDEAHQRQGHASELVLDAVARALDAGCDPIFLVADAEDWPKELYRRLGFTDLARLRCFAH